MAEGTPTGTVAEVMSSPPVTAVPSETLAGASSRMRDRSVGSVIVGDVRGLEGFYHYRQYNAVELADKRRLEDVWFLLFDGHLPSRAERDAFLREVAPRRRIPDGVRPVLPAIAAASSSVMEGLRTA